MPRHDKYKLELTGKQAEYLSVALFEFGEIFEKAKSEYMFKALKSKLNDVCKKHQKSEQFYKEMIIYKYVIFENVSLNIPSDSKILSFGIQNERAVIWVMVNKSSENVERKFRLYGTGWSIEEPVEELDFIGTVQDKGLVWHLFECND
jgi:hypothetical protein